jgi:hypothetical protein
MSKSIFQGTGYNPAIGPQSTDPSLQSYVSQSNPSSPLPSPGKVKKQLNITNLIYDRNLYRTKHEISISSISFLFMQIIQINLKNSKSLLDLERKLNNLGYSIGLKFLELSSLRENFKNNISSSAKSNLSQRNIKILQILQFIVSNIWLNLFDKKADSLEKSSDHENQFMIIDNNPIMTRFISLPKEYESLNCESFVAGIIEGILDLAYFNCEVSAHSVPQESFPNRTIYLIKFDQYVLSREARQEK